MILCVDIGNTSIKCGCMRGGRVLRVAVVPARSSVGSIARTIARACAGPGAVQAAVVSSVVPAVTDVVRRAIRRETGLDALIVSHRAALPFEIATRRPARVGADRLCAAAAATRGRARSAIVVDAGSAITVDLVIDRRFLGGVILAGPQTMLSSLHASTAQLPNLRVPAAAPARIDDTRPAMEWGAFLGSVGGIEASVRMLRMRAPARIPVWLTGGSAGALRAWLPSRWKYQPHLTLIGLAEIACLNARTY